MVKLQVVKQARLRVPRQSLERALKSLVQELRITSRGQVVLAIVSGQTIKKLNHQYRGKNQITDVLSFAMPDSTGYWGDILICAPRVIQQARGKNHSTAREIVILFIHGALHLLGYDHETGPQAKVMEGLEEKIIAKMKL